MAESQYGKYIKKQTAPSPPPEAKPVSLDGLKDWGGIQHRMFWKHVTQPIVMADQPHSHDCDEFLCFSASNPADSFDFGAEIELSMGKEGEKHLIDAATIVCVPKGTVHGPLNFTKVDKTVLFSVVYLAPEYVRKPA